MTKETAVKTLARGLAFAAMAALGAGLCAGKAAASEFEIVATSFTADNQVNVSSVAYFQKQQTTPANPSNATTFGVAGPGGLYFDGVYYNVWDTNAGAWVKLATGTVSASATSGSGTANRLAVWTSANAMGNSQLNQDSGASLTLLAASSFTVLGNVALGGLLGIGTTSPGAALDLEAGNMTVNGGGNASFGNSGNVTISPTGASSSVTMNPAGASANVTVMGLKVTSSGAMTILTSASGAQVVKIK